MVSDKLVYNNIILQHNILKNTNSKLLLTLITEKYKMVYLYQVRVAFELEYSTTYRLHGDIKTDIPLYNHRWTLQEVVYLCTSLYI